MKTYVKMLVECKRHNDTYVKLGVEYGSTNVMKTYATKYQWSREERTNAYSVKESREYRKELSTGRHMRQAISREKKVTPA